MIFSSVIPLTTAIVDNFALCNDLIRYSDVSPALKWGRPRYKNKRNQRDIKILRSSYAYVAIVTISVRERLLADQPALNAYANHVLTENKFKHKNAHSYVSRACPH